MGCRRIFIITDGNRTASGKPEVAVCSLPVGRALLSCAGAGIVGEFNLCSVCGTVNRGHVLWPIVKMLTFDNKRVIWLRNVGGTM